MKQKQLQRKQGIFRRTVRKVGKALMVPLVAGLFLAGKADAKPQKQLIGCRTPAGVRSDRLAVGQRIWIEVNPGNMYKIKITKITRDNVTYDITIPFGKHMPSNNILFYDMTLMGVQVPRAKMEQFVDMACQSRNSKSNKPIKEIDFANAEIVPIFNALMGMFKGGEPINEEILFDTKSFSGSISSYNVSIIEENKREFRLEFWKAGSKPIVVRLSREITQRVKFFENSGHFATPLRITFLSIDRGKVKGTLKVDCTRKLHMETFMSEHPVTTHPSCRR
jgi:hypothetical protein